MKKLFAFLLAVVLAFACGASAFAAGEEKPFPDSRFFESGDYRLHYRVIPAQGPQKGRILMLHGFLCSTYAWRNLAAEMAAQGYECVLVDLPDFGYSTRETETTRIVPREDLVTELMQTFAPTEEWIVAGHSMGGSVAVNIAVAHPVRALLLYCPCPQDAFPAGMKGFITSRGMKTCMDLFFRYGTKISPLVRLAVFAATNDLPFTAAYDLAGVTDPVQYDHFGAGLCEMMYSVLPTRLDEAGAIRCPVLLCQADRDVILTRSLKARMNDAFPNAETYTVHGGGHQCIENRAPELAGVTVRFLERA